MVHMAPLHNAVSAGNLAEVRRLVNARANVNARNNDRLTPLMIAAYRGHANVIRYLLSKGANARARQNQNHPRTALIYAVEKGNVNSVRALIRHSNLNVKDGNGRSALTTAANLQMPNLVRMLVRAGAKPNEATLEYIMNNNAMKNLIGSALVRRIAMKKTVVPRMHAAMTARKNRNLAMRQQLGRAGLPPAVRNLIGTMVRGRKL
jgi:ankyrin repeat protein